MAKPTNALGCAMQKKHCRCTEAGRVKKGEGTFPQNSGVTILEKKGGGGTSHWKRLAISRLGGDSCQSRKPKEPPAHTVHS